MFLHMLSKDDQSRFLRIASLFCISDASALWDGKTKAEITGETNISDVSLNISEAKQSAIDEMFRECGAGIESGDSFSEIFNGVYGLGEFKDVKKEFINRLKTQPLDQQNDLSRRQTIAVPMLHEFSEKWVTPVTADKIMMFELLLLCQAGGAMSAVEEALTKEFVKARDIDDFIVEELTERAQAISRETIRTLSLILE